MGQFLLDETKWMQFFSLRHEWWISYNHRYPAWQDSSTCSRTIGELGQLSRKYVLRCLRNRRKSYIDRVKFVVRIAEGRLVKPVVIKADMPNKRFEYLVKGQEGLLKSWNKSYEGSLVYGVVDYDTHNQCFTWNKIPFPFYFQQLIMSDSDNSGSDYFNIDKIRSKNQLKASSTWKFSFLYLLI